jgi:hypothetical protein
MLGRAMPCAPPRRVVRVRGPALAALGCAAVFAAALAATFHPYLGSDLERVAPAVPRPDARGVDHPGGSLGAIDHRFVAWLVARNAWTLLHRPLSLFDAEPCYPEPAALTLGEPGIAFGVAGIPAWLATGDPVATYSLALVTLVLVWGIALYLLVRDWTGLASAGLVAALLFAFHPVRLDEIVHPYAWDDGWAALALYFAVRLAERHRWRDALGLAAAGALQLASSLYATLGAALLGIPLLAWLLASQRLREQRPAQWLAAALLAGAAGAACFAPYLARRAEGTLAPRAYQIYLGWPSLAPGAEYWPGLALLLLAAAGVALRGSRFASGLRSDPRAALALGALLALFAATGGASVALPGAEPGSPATRIVPNFYAWLAALLPGLDVIRGVSRLYSGVLLALCILAGLGTAALVRAVPPRARGAVAALLVLAACLDTFRPASLGLVPRVSFQMTEIAPSRAQLDFFARLAELGDAGPIAEVPLDRKTQLRNNTAILLTAYHHRRTSACRNSFLPPRLGALEATLARLPDPDAVRELRELGFATIVVHHESGGPRLEALRRRFERRASLPGSPLAPLHASEALSAYSIAR